MASTAATVAAATAETTPNINNSNNNNNSIQLEISTSAVEMVETAERGGQNNHPTAPDSPYSPPNSLFEAVVVALMGMSTSPAHIVSTSSGNAPMDSATRQQVSEVTFGSVTESVQVDMLTGRILGRQCNNNNYSGHGDDGNSKDGHSSVLSANEEEEMVSTAMTSLSSSIVTKSSRYPKAAAVPSMASSSASDENYGTNIHPYNRRNKTVPENNDQVRNSNSDEEQQRYIDRNSYSQDNHRRDHGENCSFRRSNTGGGGEDIVGRNYCNELRENLEDVLPSPPSSEWLPTATATTNSTTTKSLMDGSSSTYSSKGGGGVPREEEERRKRSSSIDESMNSDMMKLQLGAHLERGGFGGDGGCEMSLMSSMMELQQGLPMLSMGRSDSSPVEEEDHYEDENNNHRHQTSVHSPIRRREEAIHTMAEALSLHHHQYQLTATTPQSIIINNNNSSSSSNNNNNNNNNKPPTLIRDSYPSLMDALQSGSSFGSIPHYNGRGYIGGEDDEDASGEVGGDEDDGEEEESREDSLTYTQFHYTLHHQKQENQQQYQSDADHILKATPLDPSSRNHPPDTQRTVSSSTAVHLPVLSRASAGGHLDPRMNIDYERHYIVDLERINEEGSAPVSRVGVLPLGGGNQAINNAIQSSHNQMHRQPRQHGQLVHLPPSSKDVVNLHQQHYHPMAPAPQTQQQPNNQFYNYRHQYYQEQYHDDNETAQTSKYDDDTESTCSSVTLSQAFQGSDSDSCESYDGLNSSVSSITFSQVDQHEHEQGYYVATKLGDFVHAPNEIDVREEVVVPPTDTNLNTAEKDDSPANDTTTYETTATNSDEVSDTTAAPPPPPPPPPNENDNNQKQVVETAEDMDDMASDLLAAIVPECGVPIQSVMAKVGASRRKPSNTGLLLPWHSSRSIQNYRRHYGNQRKKGGRHQQQPANSSLFSIGSVHTFRG